MFAGLDPPVEAIQDMRVAPLKSEVDDVKDGRFWHAGLVTGRAPAAKRKFPLRAGNTLIGFAVNQFT